MQSRALEAQKGEHLVWYSIADVCVMMVVYDVLHGMTAPAV